MKDYKVILHIIFPLFVFISNLAFGTGQFGDRLVYDNDTLVIFSNPLEQYWKSGENRTLNGKELSWTSTACYRGYIATWKIENDSLFLINLQDVSLKGESSMFGLSEIVENFDLASEFGTKRVYASWFTGEIRSQLGSMLSYIHAGYVSIFEKEKILNLKRGVVSSITDTSYVEYEKERVHPSIDYLTDTIKRIIYNNLDTAKFRTFNEDDNFELIIVFDKNGRINSISENYGDDSPVLSNLILNAAKLSLQKFPLIMKVNHEGYTPPIIRIWFHGHCLKHPDDAEYGCDDYRKLIDSKPVEVQAKGFNSFIDDSWILILVSTVILVAGSIFFVKRRRNYKRMLTQAKKS